MERYKTTSIARHNIKKNFSHKTLKILKELRNNVLKKKINTVKFIKAVIDNIK